MVPLPLAGAAAGAAAVEEDDPVGATTGPSTLAGAAVLVPLAVLWLGGVDATGAVHGRSRRSRSRRSRSRRSRSRRSRSRRSRSRRSRSRRSRHRTALGRQDRHDLGHHTGHRLGHDRDGTGRASTRRTSLTGSLRGGWSGEDEGQEERDSHSSTDGQRRPQGQPPQPGWPCRREDSEIPLHGAQRRHTVRDPARACRPATDRSPLAIRRADLGG